MEGNRKNEYDNDEYKRGYEDGRCGVDPATAVADGFIGANRSSSYRAGREAGERDREKYGKRDREGFSIGMDEIIGFGDKASLGSERHSGGGSSHRRGNKRRKSSRNHSSKIYPSSSPLTKGQVIGFIIFQIVGAYFIFGSLAHWNPQVTGLSSFLLFFAWAVLRLVLMILLIPGVIVLSFIF